MRNVEKDKLAGSEKPFAISASANAYKEHKPSNALSTILENRDLANSSRYDLARRQQQDTQADARRTCHTTVQFSSRYYSFRPLAFGTFVVTRRQTPPNDYRALLPKLNAMEPSTPNQLPSLQSLQLSDIKLQISDLKMMQMASAVIGMTRERGGKSDEEALHKPESVSTSVEQPKPGASEKERQQAVVWLAQDVYLGVFLEDAEGRLSDQLKVVGKLRDLALNMKGEEGMNKIHEMVVDELGGVVLSLLPQRAL
ncbi:MAG: hypothetical protein Q9178_007847 [Gyalolechia marmorata]